MKARSATLAIAALVLWLVPSGSLAQGNSGKSRLTICHIPPGNPGARRTMTIPEPAWRGHQAHGDYLGPCDGYSEGASGDYGDEYGEDTQRAKKGKKAKRRDGKKYRSGSDGDDADDEIEVGGRAGESEEVAEADSGSGETEVDETDRRARREKRRAERRARREQRIRDRDGSATDESQTEEGTTSDDADEVEAGDAGAGTDETQAAKRRAERRARTGDRSKRGTQPDAENDEPPEEEQGFFHGMRQFFGFGGDETDEPSGNASGDVVE